jgi:hypothetical protein
MVQLLRHGVKARRRAEHQLALTTVLNGEIVMPDAARQSNFHDYKVLRMASSSTMP